LITICPFCFQSKDNAKLDAVKNVETAFVRDLHVSLGPFFFLIQRYAALLHVREKKENQLAKTVAPALDRNG
jgi:hypothetical protein